MNEWVKVLADAVAAPGMSQNKMANQLGVSTSMLSQVLRGIYPGNTEKLQMKVEGQFMNRVVNCPIKGEIPIDECHEHQQRPFSSANRERVKLYRACRSGCPYSSLEATAKQQALEVKNKGTEIYNLARQLEYIKNLAACDKDKLTELLERELTRLATRHNQMIWNKKQVRKSHHE